MNSIRWWSPYGKVGHWKSPWHNWWCAIHIYELSYEELLFVNWFIWYYNFELVNIILGKVRMITCTIWSDNEKMGWLPQICWLWKHTCSRMLSFLIGTLIMFESSTNPSLQCKYKAIDRWCLHCTKFFKVIQNVLYILKVVESLTIKMDVTKFP